MNRKPLAVTLGLPKDHTIVENGEQLEIDAPTATHLVKLGLIYDHGETVDAKLYHLVDPHTFAAAEETITAFLAPQQTGVNAGGETLRAVALRKTPVGYKAMGPGLHGENEIVFVSETEPYYFSLALVERIVARSKVLRLNTYIDGRDGDDFTVSQPMDGERSMEKAVRVGIEDGLYEIALKKTRTTKPMAAVPAAHYLAA